MRPADHVPTHTEREDRLSLLHYSRAAFEGCPECVVGSAGSNWSAVAARGGGKAQPDGGSRRRSRESAPVLRPGAARRGRHDRRDLAFGLKGDHRFYGLLVTAGLFVLVVAVVGFITYTRPGNLQRQVEQMEDIINSKGFTDAIEEIVEEKLRCEGRVDHET